MEDTKKHGGARKGAGRPSTGDPTKKFSISARTSEYEQIIEKAKKAKKSISRYLVDLALKEENVK